MTEGDVYLVWLRDECRAMMARVYVASDTHLRLQPVNPLLEPLYYKARDVEFRGRVVKTIRVEKPFGYWPS